MVTSSNASLERDRPDETSSRKGSSDSTFETKVRGTIALLITVLALCFPAVTLIQFFVGQISASDMVDVLQDSFLLFGPLLGMILGYYFR